MNPSLKDIVKEELQKLIDESYLRQLVGLSFVVGSKEKWDCARSFNIPSRTLGGPKQNSYHPKGPTSQKQRDVRSFLGLDGYYQRFIEDFSKLASPLFGLLAKDSKFVWSKSCQEALDTLTEKLTTTPILRGPNWALPFHIHADASHKAIGAALG
eukprot:PITA_13411